MGANFRQPPNAGAEAVIVSKNITANGTYNASSDSADGYNPVTVNVPSQIIPTRYQGSSYLYVATDGNIWVDTTNNYYVNVWDVDPGTYVLFIGNTTGNRNRISYKNGYNYDDIANAIDTRPSTSEVYLTTDLSALNDSDMLKRVILNISSPGVIVYVTSNQSQVIPAYCVKLQ